MKAKADEWKIKRQRQDDGWESQWWECVNEEEREEDKETRMIG